MSPRKRPVEVVVEDPDRLSASLRGWVGTEAQFVIGATAPAVPGMDRSASLGPLSLFAGPDLRTVELADRHGRRIGIMLGLAISIADERILGDGTERVPVDLDDTNFLAELEDHLYGHGGSWLFILDTPDHRRIYLDADGTLSVVYDPGDGRVASTASALLSPDDYVDRFRGDLFDQLDVAHEGWFPSGLTAHRDVRRLLCNHYLDLDSFTTHRHWPTAAFEPMELEEASQRIAAATASICRAVLPLDPVCSLSGGNETRFVLSAMRDVHEGVRFVTVEGPSTRRDGVLARRLASQFELDHVEIPVTWASPEEQAAWLRRAGHAIGGSNALTHPTIWGMERHHRVQLGGLGGEIGRAFLWRTTDSDDVPLTHRDLVPRLGLPSPPEVDAATEEWFAGVQGFDPLVQLDLAYLELRMSAWAFAQTYTNRARLPLIHPMISREAYRSMMSLAPRHRRDGSYVRAGIRQQWPELLEVPINQYGDARDALQWLSRATDPRRVVKKIRKLYG